MFFNYYYCLVFLSVRLILICTKQTVIHAAFSETRDSLIPQKSIFNILSLSALWQIPHPSSLSKLPRYTHTCWYSSKATWRNIPKQTNHQTRRNTQDHKKRNNVEQIGLITNIDIIAVMINFRFSSALCYLLRTAKMARPKIAIITARIILHLISYPQFTYDLFHMDHSPSYLSREHMNPKLTCS